MSKLTKFEITKPNKGAEYVSGIYDSAAPRGLALGAHDTDPTKFRLANNDNFIGFLCREVVVGGLTEVEHLLGMRNSTTPTGLEGPYTAGESVSVERAYEVEVEGSDFILLTGTGSISSTTPVGSTLAFLEGKLRIAQSGEVVNGTISAVWTDDADLCDPDTNGFRLRVQLNG